MSSKSFVVYLGVRLEGLALCCLRYRLNEFVAGEMAVGKIKQDQLPKRFRDIIDTEVNHYAVGRSVEEKPKIPNTDDIPIEKPRKWLKIHDVICVFVDMLGSTNLSATANPHQTAGLYRLFTETAVRLFHEFDSPYIDVQGDGAFALFNKGQEHRALAAAVTFKTFADLVFLPEAEKATDSDIGAHIGIDQKLVLVRKVGLKIAGGRSDRQNEVWAGKPINMASKLASRSSHGQLIVSDRFHRNLTDRKATRSCGCGTDGKGKVTDLWESEDITDESLFDFDKFFVLNSQWCKTHGNEYCEALLDFDE